MRFRSTRNEPRTELNNWGSTLEERRALDEMFSVTYEELRRLASTVKRSDPSATFTPTALVNQAWLKLARSPRFTTTSPLHFKRIAARAMRQVLVEAARRRGSYKRGGDGAVTFVVLGDPAAETALCREDLLALEDALKELERLEPRQALLVESRFFGGLDVSETAALLEVSEATVHREWRVAKAWLKHRLRPAR
ncbi:MAG: sigma-70 family RNA polymerase sigma factor [Acidobacteriia bacterium]|nr:sigma-70 family RNA polymerase sigma factor [Terriglobia bacterium]